MTRVNLVALVAFAGLLVWVFTLKPEVRTALQEGVLEMFYPVQKTGDTVREKIVVASEDSRVPYEELAAENVQLRLQVAQTQLENQEISRIIDENNRFRDMLGFERDSLLSMIPAKIIGRETSSWWSTVVIDRGFDQGVRVDSPVVTELGIVGKTTLVGKNSATVLLFTDELCRVGANIAGSNEQGIATGTRGLTKLSPDLRLRYLSKDANPEPGAKVYSSNAGGLFPAGFAIGEVKEFRQLDLYGEALLRPAVDFGELTYVFVIERQDSQVNPAGSGAATGETAASTPDGL